MFKFVNEIVEDGKGSLLFLLLWEIEGRSGVEFVIVDVSMGRTLLESCFYVHDVGGFGLWSGWFLEHNCYYKSLK